MNDKRLTTRMVKVWDKLAELQPPPLFAQFNYNTISDIWQQCAVLSVNPSANDNISFNIEFMGDKAAEIMVNQKEGGKLTTKTFDRTYKKMLSGIAQSVSDQEVKINSGSTVSQGNKVLKYRVCLLPFSDGHQNVTHIIVGFSWMQC